MVQREELENLGFVDTVQPYLIVNEARLEKIMLAMDFSKPNGLRYDLRYDMRQDYIERQVLYRYQMFVWGQNNQPIEIKVASSWWDMFKDRFFPARLRELFPSKYITHTITSKTLYPLLNIQTPDLTHTLYYQYTIEK